jgi:hypothetical protein
MADNLRVATGERRLVDQNIASWNRATECSGRCRPSDSHGRVQADLM